MAFQEISDLDAATTISIGGYNKKLRKENPTAVEGYFLGSKATKNNKSASGVSYLHILQTSKGNVGVWGKTDMDRKLASATPGTMIKIEFSGMQATKNGEMYKYKVSVDKDATIEVAPPPAAKPTAASSYDEDQAYVDSESEEDDAFDSGERYEAPAPLAASANSKSRQAAVQAMLSKKAVK